MKSVRENGSLDLENGTGDAVMVIEFKIGAPMVASIKNRTAKFNRICMRTGRIIGRRWVHLGVAAITI